MIELGLGVIIVLIVLYVVVCLVVIFESDHYFKTAKEIIKHAVYLVLMAGLWLMMIVFGLFAMYCIGAFVLKYFN